MKKILIIEDDLAHITALKQALDDSSFKIDSAYDGISGLEAIKQIKPDLVILDLLLPKMHGIIVLKNIRWDPETAAVKVLVLTNLVQNNLMKEAQELGIEDYLIKSDNPIQKVAERVKEILK